jgi:uncharacterized membrane protein YhaH (DUF805 family)
MVSFDHNIHICDNVLNMITIKRQNVIVLLLLLIATFLLGTSVGAMRVTDIEKVEK